MIPEELAKDHYLLVQEKKTFDNRGNKTSKPQTRFVAIADFYAFADERYFEKHGIDVEILHDPTLKGEASIPQMKVNTGAEGGNADNGTGNPPAAPKGKPLTKAQLIDKLAKLLDVEPSTIDAKMTNKDLEARIAEEEAAKG